MLKSVITLTLGLLSLLGSATLLTGCDRSDAIELVLEAERPGAATDEAMERAREIVERRVSALASGATVTRQGDRILVTLDRREDAELVKALIRRSGRLEFRLVDTNATPHQLSMGEAPPGSVIFAFPENGPNGRIAVARQRIITGSMIADARPDFDGQGRPAVTIRFDTAGTRRFARATRENVALPLAIIVDDVVISAAVISEPIVGGYAQISGNFTVEDTRQFATTLRSGPLPIDLVVIEERVLAR